MASVVTGILNYGYTLVLARYLASSAYATFAACQTIILLAATVAAAALPWLLAREMSLYRDDEERRRQAIWFCLSVNILVGAVTAVIGAIAVSRFASPSIVLLLAVSVFGGFVISTWLGWAQGMARHRLLAGIMLSQVTLKVLVGFVAVHLSHSVAGALDGNAVSVVILTVAGAVSMRREIRHAAGSLLSAYLWKQAVVMGVLQATSSYLGSVDVLTSVEVIPVGPRTGSYQFANALGRVPTFLAAAIATAAFPLMLRSAHPGRVVRRSFGRLLTLGLPLCVGVGFAPKVYLALLVPARYSRVSHYIPYAAFNGLGSAVLIMQLNFLKAEISHRRTLITCALLSVGLSVVVAFAALSDGVDGIAISASIGVWAAAVAICLGSGSNRPNMLPPVNTLVVAVGAGAVLLGVRGAPTVWVVASVVLSPIVIGAAFDRSPLPWLARRLAARP